MDMNQLVEAVRAKPEDERLALINQLLAGKNDYTTSEVKALGQQRALFCSRLSKEKLWPER